jgi:RNA polymerase sigma-70 factor, ECF subfamily
MEISKEKELIKRAKKDPEAFGEIFEEYYEPIFGYVLKRTGNVHVSQDIVSETFFKALDRLWQFRWRNISISSWLYRIATNELSQYFRKNKKIRYSIESLLEKGSMDFQGEINLEEEIMDQEKELEMAQEWKIAKGIIDSLPEKYQDVLFLRYFEDKKIFEIAEILRKKQGTIKSLLSRGLKMIRSKMQPIQDSDVLEADSVVESGK